MSRYIDADALLKTINENVAEAHNERCAQLLEAIVYAPTADVVEVRHGEWEYEQLDEYKYYKVTCPYCNAEYYGNYDAYHDPDDFNYCPNCGAKMDGEKALKERSENGT